MLSSIQYQTKTLIWVFVVITLASIFVGVGGDMYYLMGIPFFLLLVYWTVVDFRSVFYLLLFCLPLSIEYELPNGFGTDLPTEPLVVGLMMAFLFYVANGGRGRRMMRSNETGGDFGSEKVLSLRDERQEGDERFYQRFVSTGQESGGLSRFYQRFVPAGQGGVRRIAGSYGLSGFNLILFVHFCWIGLAALYAVHPFIAFKFLLAKVWYIVTFYFLAGMVLRDKREMMKFGWVIFIPLVAMTLLTIARHSAYGFSFKDVKAVVGPYFRNHVSYACMLVVFFPYILMLRHWQARWSFKWMVLSVGILVFLVGVYFSYTRAAYVALVGAAGFYWVVRFRLTRYMVGGIVVVGLVWVTFVVNRNKFLEYAPNFKKTITHTHFDQLLTATYKLEDISTMERVYRWVAGFQMVSDRPLLGFGPNNFYDSYRSYTVTGFKTYVSKNPEHSGIHCYFLMTAVEQGLPGMVIFMALCFYGLLYGERAYHSAVDPDRRRIVMTALLSFFIILQLILINDLIETDKVGSFFFMALAILGRTRRRTKDEGRGTKDEG